MTEPESDASGIIAALHQCVDPLVRSAELHTDQLLAIGALLHALIQTHPNPRALLEAFYVEMDSAAEVMPRPDSARCFGAFLQKLTDRSVR